MKEQFKSIPAPLQRQIVIRLLGSVIGFVSFILLWIYLRDWHYLVPSLAIAAVFAISAALLFWRCVTGRYVALTGSCTELDKSVLRRRIKNVYLQNDQHRVKIVSPQGRMKNIRVGDELTVYISDNAPVYEMDGYKVICSILALGKEASA